MTVLILGIITACRHATRTPKDPPCNPQRQKPARARCSSYRDIVGDTCACTHVARTVRNNLRNNGRKRRTRSTNPYNKHRNCRSIYCTRDGLVDTRPAVGNPSDRFRYCCHLPYTQYIHTTVICTNRHNTESHPCLCSQTTRLANKDLTVVGSERPHPTCSASHPHYCFHT